MTVIFICTVAYAAAINIPFPKVTDQTTFILYNLALYYTFFGCLPDVTLFLRDVKAPESAFTNDMFVQSNYYRTQLRGSFNNTFDLYTFVNNTVNSEWSGCLACWFMLRSLE
jgi:hypothetical protein